MNTNVLYLYSTLEFPKCCHDTLEIGKRGIIFPFCTLKLLSSEGLNEWSKAKQRLGFNSWTHRVTVLCTIQAAPRKPTGRYLYNSQTSGTFLYNAISFSNMAMEHLPEPWGLLIIYTHFQNQETIETRGGMVWRSCFILWIGTISFLKNLSWNRLSYYLGAESSVLSVAEWRSMFVLMQDPQLTMKQSQVIQTHRRWAA